MSEMGERLEKVFATLRRNGPMAPTGLSKETVSTVLNKQDSVPPITQEQRERAERVRPWVEAGEGTAEERVLLEAVDKAAEKAKQG